MRYLLDDTKTQCLSKIVACITALLSVTMLSCKEKPSSVRRASDSARGENQSAIRFQQARKLGQSLCFCEEHL